MTTPREALEAEVMERLSTLIAEAEGALGGAMLCLSQGEYTEAERLLRHAAASAALAAIGADVMSVP